MPGDYAYPIAQCDVTTGKRTALQSYRDKRRLWLSWIDTDVHHAIWRFVVNGVDGCFVQGAGTLRCQRRK